MGTRRTLYNVLVQLGLLLGLAGLITYFAVNASRNLEARSIASGFSFLGNKASFELGANLTGFRAGDTFADAFIAGVVNTLAVSIASIVVATLVGIVIGVVRLSRNPLAKSLAIGYVEVLRNIPLLLQMLFWYAIVTKTLPTPRQALNPMEGVFLTNRGAYAPLPDNATLILGLVLLGIVWWGLSVLLKRYLGENTVTNSGWRKLYQARYIIYLIYGLGLLMVLIATASNVPELKGFNFRGGGYVPPECVAVFLALTIYTSAFIAENVRSGILGVDKGQLEAAQAVGLKPSTTMAYIVFPQALRIIVPPVASQYLNIVKNSSLAVAVGYADIMRVATIVVSETGRAIEAIAIIMGLYLLFSLIISLLMNLYNHRIMRKGG